MQAIWKKEYKVLRHQKAPFNTNIPGWQLTFSK